ncbi:MAG: M10 family metallopeptidase C-terminal domain-containing protein, partial [Hyphomicrobiales bacterium]
PGADTFVFISVNDSLPGARDSILEFEPGVDRIFLRPIDADTTTAGNQAFTFIDNALFSDTPGELSFRNEILSGDVDGDGVADFEIHFAELSSLSDSDIIL